MKSLRDHVVLIMKIVIGAAALIMSGCAQSQHGQGMSKADWTDARRELQKKIDDDPQLARFNERVRQTFAEQNTPSSAGQQVVTKGDKQPRNWQTRFTFEGQIRPGPYLVDPHIWVYTKAFAERFGMSMEWTEQGLKGVEAAAWRKTKTGEVTCGWGGKKEACKEEQSAVLVLFFDTTKVKLPWAPWSRDSDQKSLGADRYLTPQECETRRKNSYSPVALAFFPETNDCKEYMEKQPFADPQTGVDVFMFEKGITYSAQGNIVRIGAYDKSSYPNLAWVQIGYTRPVGLYNAPEAAVITLETRDAPLGKTLRSFHKIVLPENFDSRIKAVLDAGRDAEREFYKKSLDIK